MKYEEAYYYFAVFLGRVMQRTASWDMGSGWEVFWAEKRHGKTDGWDAFSKFSLAMVEEKRNLMKHNGIEGACSLCGDYCFIEELAFLDPPVCLECLGRILRENKRLSEELLRTLKPYLLKRNS